MSRIILPLDGMDSIEDINRVVDHIQRSQITLGGKSLIWGFKVNDALIQHGVHVVQEIKRKGFKVFADPKLHDIPNTNHNSLNHLIDAGADIISVHCSADYAPYNQSNRKESDYIAGITVLTSISQSNCFNIYGCSVTSTVKYLALEKALKYGYSYLVCSAKDLITLPELTNKEKVNFKLICPGIRPDWYQTKDDQKRVMTPAEAIKAGADLLVIGRPILQADDMVDALIRTNEEIEAAEGE